MEHEECIIKERELRQAENELGKHACAYLVGSKHALVKDKVRRVHKQAGN